MIDMAECSFKPLDPAEQERFERRALALDDNDEPPIIIDKDGNYIDTIDEE